MEYILGKDGEGIDYSRYIQEFEKYRDKLPEGVASFGSDEERFELNNPKSLHDCWLEELRIKEFRADEKNSSEVQIFLSLFSHRHDRIIEIAYHEVKSYKSECIQDEFAYYDTKHGDIYTHEVRVSEGGNVIHEILFVTGSELVVECSNFTVEDRILSSSDG